MAGDKEKDLELWRAYKASGSKADLQSLLRQMNGLIQKECSRWQGVLARDILELEGARLAKQAFDSYNPAAGTALSTHVVNYLQKLSRLVYQHQNLARIPEYQTLKINTFNKANTDLEATHGRPPTVSELANHLAWSNAAVERMRKQLRKENLESVSSELPPVGTTSNDNMVDLVYHDLAPLHKAVFEHTTGYGGAEILPGKDLTKKLGITQGQLSYIRTKLRENFEKFM